MFWQDIVLTVAQLGFVAALMPTVTARGGKPPLLTSVPTAIGLAAISFTMATLGLWLSAAAAALSCALWLTIAAQRWQRTRP
jgi:hypothetical protein